MASGPVTEAGEVWLVSRSNYLTNNQEFPLHEAVLRCDLEAVERSLAEGANPNHLDNLGMSPLVWAVYGGYAEIVEALCRSGADVAMPVVSGATPLWHAEDDFGLWKIAAILRRYGAKAK